MVARLGYLINQVYKSKIMAQKAQLKQLQAKINPHFIFNSLFILKRMISLEDYEGAEQLSTHLGEYFKFITRSNNDMVNLEEEYRHVLAYVSVQSIRFSNRISFMFDECPEKYRNLKVPKLIIQPFVENSFVHGLSEVEENGVIKLSFSNLNGRGVKITIEDNGKNLSDTEIERMSALIKRCDCNEIETTAIINVHQRLRLTFGPESGIKISRSPLGGLKTVLSIVITRT